MHDIIIRGGVFMKKKPWLHLFFTITILLVMGRESIFATEKLKNAEAVAYTQNGKVMYKPSKDQKPICIMTLNDSGKNTARLFTFSENGKYLYFFSDDDWQQKGEILCCVDLDTLEAHVADNKDKVHIIARNVRNNYTLVGDQELIYKKYGWQLCYYDGSDNKNNITKVITDDMEKGTFGYDKKRKRINYWKINEKGSALYSYDILQNKSKLIGELPGGYEGNWVYNYEDSDFLIYYKGNDKVGQLWLGNALGENQLIFEIKKINQQEYIEDVVFDSKNKQIYFLVHRLKARPLYEFVDDPPNLIQYTNPERTKLRESLKQETVDDMVREAYCYSYGVVTKLIDESCSKMFASKDKKFFAYRLHANPMEKRSILYIDDIKDFKEEVQRACVSSGNPYSCYFMNGKKNVITWKQVFDDNYPASQDMRYMLTLDNRIHFSIMEEGGHLYELKNGELNEIQVITGKLYNYKWINNTLHYLTGHGNCFSHDDKMSLYRFENGKSEPIFEEMPNPRVIYYPDGNYICIEISKINSKHTLYLITKQKVKTKIGEQVKDYSYVNEKCIYLYMQGNLYLFEGEGKMRCIAENIGSYGCMKQEGERLD